MFTYNLCTLTPSQVDEEDALSPTGRWARPQPLADHPRSLYSLRSNPSSCAISHNLAYAPNEPYGGAHLLHMSYETDIRPKRSVSYPFRDDGRRQPYYG